MIQDVSERLASAQQISSSVTSEANIMVSDGSVLPTIVKNSLRNVQFRMPAVSMARFRGRAGQVWQRREKFSAFQSLGNFHRLRVGTKAVLIYLLDRGLHSITERSLTIHQIIPNWLVIKQAR